MIDLVKMYDAMNKIDEANTLLFGCAFSLGLDDGILGNMTRVSNIIRRECNPKLVDNELDLENNEYYKILISDNTAEERVDVLFSGVHVAGYIRKECLKLGDKLKPIGVDLRWSTAFIITSIESNNIVTDEGTVHSIEEVPTLFYYINKNKTYIDII